jgi:hypothetical protein
MTTRTFALIFGIVFLLAGAAGFIPGLLHPVPANAPALTVGTGYGYLLGLLPVNVLHNLVHVLFGVLGLVAYAGKMSPRLYAQIVAVSYILLTILGLLPLTNTLFGLVPIFGFDVWLHLALGLVAAWFGFMPASSMTHHTPAAMR